MGGTDLYRNIELNERKFCIKKLNAELGSYYAQECMSKILPTGLAGQLDFIQQPKGDKSFTKQEFLEMQRDFLKACFEDLPGGRRAVIDKDGNYGITEIEYDAPLMQLLLVNSMTHTLKGFFTEAHLKQMWAAISDLLPPSVPTSESGSTPQS